ncbi:Modification methylase DpnIIB [termite gut metagenome]|uniref:site-specific DNA-methyltransferase (cytosine-N(4)-specific) n=1 Tax=termite gut metagenome TaxID=433724 RepID=A0A5J4SYS3_9ZZZZ
MDFSKKRDNDLSGKEWLQNSFSIWRDLRKAKEERTYEHPASYPVVLCEKLIKTFARANSIVLDPFNGIGSTTTACHNLQCSGTGIDLSQEFCTIAFERIAGDSNINIINGDSFDILKTLPKDSFDICLTSPPYWDILNMKRSADQKESINYSDKENDLGNIPDYEHFIVKLATLFGEAKRVLKPSGYCIVNVMDIRKKNIFYPFHSDLASAIQKVGYIYDDLIIWDRQDDYNNMRPLGYPYKFRINKVHEYLLIFIKPRSL